MHPALLTRSELEWLQGNKQVSKSFEWKMKSEIRRKLKTFENLELPLLQSHGFGLTANSKDSRGEHIKLPSNNTISKSRGHSLAWQDVSPGRWRSWVRIPLAPFTLWGYR
jgi:hypothetical protein